jgi:branched-chain amino acid transport system ATP-binding protein
VKNMLRVSDIRVYYGRIPVVHNVCFEVKQRELVSIIGSNGAGKTTILKAIAGLLHPASGKIEFFSKDISQMPTAEIVKSGITYVPEARRIFGPLSVEENLRLGSYTIRDEKVIRRNLGYVYTLFPRLEDRRKQKGGTLSGGEQGMLALGRGLMANPKLLMLDEPSLGLMPKLVTEAFKAIESLKKEGLTILLVEQNVREALELADRGYILKTGRNVQEGTGEELLRSHAVRKAFLGL